MITQNLLKEFLHYDFETGIFNWKTKPSKKTCIGDIVGRINKGYIEIKICGRRYFAHRLAWLYVYGNLPKNKIDHIDHDPLNNRIDNLRDVTNAENIQNQIRCQKNNKSSGLLGVSWHKRERKYRAQIRVFGKNKYLGVFDTAEEAHNAYIDAKRIYHSTCML